MASPPRSEIAVSQPAAVQIRLRTRCPIHRLVSYNSASALVCEPGSSCTRRLPTKVGAAAWMSASYRVLCIGPAEWLAIGCEPESKEPELAPLMSVDLSEAFVPIELLGERVEEVLSGVCGLDVHLMSFASDTCARTRLAGVAVVLDRLSPKKFECYVPRSYLSYMLAVFGESARAGAYATRLP
jgi:heterotetrameric sarcosine oxidase gamma subunit